MDVLEVPQSHTRYRMGSLLTVKIWDINISNAVVDALFDEVSRIERLLSIFQKNSEIAKINQNQSAGPISVEQETLAVIQAAFLIADQSSGAYDPTLSDFGSRSLTADLKKGILIRDQAGIQINLGGIGKGYALDRAASLLRSYGIQKSLISFRSTIVAIGPPNDQPPFQIAIQHPRKKQEKIDTVSIRDQSISTSGDYEKIDHLINPRTGLPAQGVASVSVIAPTGLQTDALSTAAFVLGTKAGIQFLDSLENVEGIIIGTEKLGLSIYNTVGWANHKIAINRRDFLKRAAAMVAGLILSPLFFTRKAFAQRFLSEEEALKKLMPSAVDQFLLQQITLTTEQMEQAQTLVGKRFRERNITVYKGILEGKTVGFGFVLDVTGKESPITFMIGIDTEGKLSGVEVLIYRESQGFEIRSNQFMKQFLGKTMTDALVLGDTISALSGATLSSRAATYAAKKALALHAVLFKGTL